jgi:geranylgeranyl diphosphate synthase type II
MYTYAELKELIDKAIVNHSFNSESEKLIAPVKYILSIGGKRLRPVTTLMSCNLFRDKIDEAVLPATGIEIFHNYTLVHDDIMDQASVRRNFPTVHTKWNLNQAILSGDVMAFIANDCFLQAPVHVMARVIRTFNKAAIEVCIGQQFDMDFEKSAFVSQEEYLHMIELKTAALLAASFKIGAIIGEANEKETDLLYCFGKNLGIAFQIQDDLLDIYGDARIFGKISGNDIVSNKKTFPYIKSMELASGVLSKKLQALFAAKEFDPDAKVKKVMEIYDQLNIKTITESLATDYINKSFHLLEKVDVDPERREELFQLACSLIGRRK